MTLFATIIFFFSSQQLSQNSHMHDIIIMTLLFSCAAVCVITYILYIIIAIYIDTRGINFKKRAHSHSPALFITSLSPNFTPSRRPPPPLSLLFRKHQLRCFQALAFGQCAHLLSIKPVLQSESGKKKERERGIFDPREK